MAEVHRPNEISLFDVSYPIIGPVRVFDAAQWAEKRVTGDYSKDDETIESSWVASDQTEGIGILDMREAMHSKRYWWGTGDTDTEGHLLLPTLVTDATNPTGVACQAMAEYNNEGYFVFGQSARRWVDATSAWSAELASLPGFPTDAIVHKSKLYFACGTDFERYDGTTWTTGTVLSGAAVACRYFIEWDSKLLAIDNTGQLRFSVDEGVTWTANALSTLPAGYFTGLFMWMDADGEPLVHLNTKEGPYALDFDNAEWRETRLATEVPFHRFGGLGGTAWRDAAYVSAGLTVYEYGDQIRVMGLDRDAGVPNEYRGVIVKLLKGINGLYALIDAAQPAEQDLYVAGDDEYGNTQFIDNLGYSWVAKWNGKGWRPVYVSEDSATAATTAMICSADDKYRLWVALNDTVFYMPLLETVQNPLEATDFPFAASMEHISPRFDADNAVIHKTATRFTVYVTDTSDTEYFMFYYRANQDTDWTLFTNSDFLDGQVDTDGEHEFTFASGAGLDFLTLQVKAAAYRGTASTTVSPDCRWMRVKYIKRLEVRWGYEVDIDCSRNYRNQTGRYREAALKAALGTHTLGEFAYRKNGATQTQRVILIPPFQGTEIGGRKREGVFTARLVAA